MLTEARVILPKWAPAHDWLERTLIAKFGGVTITTGKGAWTNEHGDVVSEPVIIYDVAVPDNEASAATLTRLGYALKERTGEDAIYIRLPGGKVVIVE